MKISTVNYNNPKQWYLPLFLSDCLDLLDPVLTFDRLMGVIDLNKYLTDIPEYTTGRLRYNPFNMLKTVLFGFMTSGYCSLREPEDNCKVNIRFMYLMDHHTPSYRTFGYFINEVLQDKIENIFNDINQAIFNEEHVDLQHIYIDGSKFEANANKYISQLLAWTIIVQIWTVSFLWWSTSNKRMVSQLHCTEIPLTVLLAVHTQG